MLTKAIDYENATATGLIKALAAGATEVHPVSNQYGWRLGRIVDPFGHHWEIGKPLGNGA